MKLTVTATAPGALEYDQEPEMVEIEFDNFTHYEIVDEYFIVHKEDGTQQGIKKYKIQKFFTSI